MPSESATHSSRQCDNATFLKIKEIITNEYLSRIRCRYVTEDFEAELTLPLPLVYLLGQKKCCSLPEG